MYQSTSILRSLVLAVTLGSVAVSSSAAHAVPMAVQMACASDYYAYCSKHDPEGPAVRACMRANGSKLSKRCVSALIAAGEVSKDEVLRRSAEVR